jgi:hypothetical protein
MSSNPYSHPANVPLTWSELRGGGLKGQPEAGYTHEPPDPVTAPVVLRLRGRCSASLGVERGPKRA